jgi:hypothetical protein
VKSRSGKAAEFAADRQSRAHERRVAVRHGKIHFQPRDVLQRDQFRPRLDVVAEAHLQDAQASGEGCADALVLQCRIDLRKFRLRRTRSELDWSNWFWEMDLSSIRRASRS